MVKTKTADKNKALIVCTKNVFKSVVFCIVERQTFLSFLLLNNIILSIFEKIKYKISKIDII